MDREKLAEKLTALAEGEELRTNRDAVRFLTRLTTATVELAIEGANGDARKVAGESLTAIAVLFDVIEALDLAGIPPAVRAIVESARTSVLLGVTAEEVLAKIELVGDAWDGPPDFVGDGGGPGPMVLGVTPDLPENPEGGAE